MEDISIKYLYEVTNTGRSILGNLMSTDCYHSKNKHLLLFLILFAIVLLAAILVFRRPESPRLYHLKAEKITAMYLRNGNKATGMDITDPDQRKEIADLLNGFSYQSAKEMPPAGGWSYCLDIETDSGKLRIDFTADCVRVPGEEGTVSYYGAPGYFQRLVDLAESAHIPL